jgi:lysine-ketoglutarate reductase/saccharopine dehydrogenase-like protein (TIGR00300 family)
MLNKVKYISPDFRNYTQCPNCLFQKAPKDMTLPDGFLSTTNHPTYVKINDVWKLPLNPRMDSHIVWVPQENQLEIREFREICKGDLVAVGLAEDGSEGVLVWDKGFSHQSSNVEEDDEDKFSFMNSEVSREKPVNYESIYDEFLFHREQGYIIWVIGPALVHSRGREAMEWLIGNGYCHALLSGNAVAVHDIESALFGSTLGMKSDGSGEAGGHSCHMRAINEVKKEGSIVNLIENNKLTTGIMYTLYENKVPYVLCGSIRDDGPLPETITDAVLSQREMRKHTTKATMVVMVATALHSIAVGNMMPTYYQDAQGELREITTLCVDQTEFLVSKLKDRGTHQAFGVVTNAQDFMRLLYLELQMRQSK